MNECRHSSEDTGAGVGSVVVMGRGRRFFLRTKVCLKATVTLSSTEHLFLRLSGINGENTATQWIFLLVSLFLTHTTPLASLCNSL